jgi:multicomponent Na+:H+ antiporter subunit C
VSQTTLYACSGLGVAMVALHGLFTGEHLLRKIIAANLVGTGVFVVFIALARRASPTSPDPVPHALVLTGIVVSVSATALALALANRLHHWRDEAPPGRERRGEADGP